MLQMKETPEVHETFNKMADNITNIIEDDIRQGQRWTQTHIDWYHADLGVISQGAYNLQTNADLFYDELATCRRGLFSQASVICTCEADRDRLCETADNLCPVTDFTTWHLADTHFGQKWCDLHDEDVPENCASIKSLNGAVNSIKTGIEDDYDTFKAAWTACEDAKKKCEDKKKECNGLIITANTKRAECQNKENDWQLEGCLFGNKVQTKCYDYKSLMGFLTQAWNASEIHFSEIDRQHEWKSIQTIKCVLTSYNRDTRDFDKTLADCDVDYKYADGVGTLDNKSTDLNNFMANYGGKSTCGHDPVVAGRWESSNAPLEGIETSTKFGAGIWIDPLGSDWCQVMHEATDKTYAASFTDIATRPYGFCGDVKDYEHQNIHATNRGVTSGTIEDSPTNIYHR